MKVAIISSSIDPTYGWGNITRELCQRLSEKIDIELFIPKISKIPKVFHFKVNPILSESIYMSTKLKFVQVLLDGLKLNLSQFDIIHSLVAFPYAISAAIASKINKKPLIVGTHGTFAVRPLNRFPDKIFLKWAYKTAKIIHSPSNYTKFRIQEAINLKNICVLLNAVNFQKFAKSVDVSALKEMYGENKIILSVGGLKPRKGIHIMIKAFKLLKNNFRNVKYLIIGDGWYKDELMKLTKKLMLEDDIHFLGKIKENELVKYYHLCDIYAHTPININDAFEGFGIVYLEAGACGKPVVASNSGGVPDAVIDGKTGILVNEYDVNDTAKALERLLVDARLAKQLGENGRKRAKTLSWENYTKKTLSLYERLLK